MSLSLVARFLWSLALYCFSFRSPFFLRLPRYAKIDKPSWWMKSRDCGPVVEQATHFVDLSRYFGGEVDLDSVQAHALGE